MLLNFDAIVLVLAFVQGLAHKSSLELLGLLFADTGHNSTDLIGPFRSKSFVFIEA